MPQTQPSLPEPPRMRDAAVDLIRSHGTAALGMAALAASRKMSVAAPEEAAFWLGVCDVIRAGRAASAAIVLH